MVRNGCWVLFWKCGITAQRAAQIYKIHYIEIRGYDRSMAAWALTQCPRNHCMTCYQLKFAIHDRHETITREQN